MTTTQAATSVKAPLTGIAGQTAPEAAGQTGGQIASQIAGQAGDQAASVIPPASGDVLAGTVSTLGQADSLFSWGGYFQALGLLFLIVAGMFLVLWFLKRKGGLGVLTRQGDLVFESKMALGPKKSLVVVRFLNKRVLLGVTDHQITMLTELPTDEDDTADNDSHAANPADFKGHLARAAQNGPEDSA